jgi:hypothetical protein
MVAREGEGADSTTTTAMMLVADMAVCLRVDISRSSGRSLSLLLRRRLCLGLALACLVPDKEGQRHSLEIMGGWTCVCFVSVRAYDGENFYFILCALGGAESWFFPKSIATDERNGGFLH